jgi:hypothetical protein
MDKIEAKSVLQIELEKYRQRSSDSLLKLLDDLDAFSVRGPSGALYQLEVQAMWDDKPGGLLRIMAGIDDGGFFSSFSPLMDGFILSPSGEILDD